MSRPEGYVRIWEGSGPAIPEPSPNAAHAAEIDAEIERERSERRLEDSRSRWALFLKRSGVPERLHGAVLEIATRTVAAVAVMTYIDGGGIARGECLVLAGPTGVGKTFAAAGAIIHGWSGRLWYFGALAGALLDPKRREEALAGCKDDALLVLDDLGTEYVKDGGLVQSFLDEIIWHREGNALPTIITTNLPAETLAERLGDRIADRLRGPWGRIVECTGSSLR
jgi:DNA replication protein DnaC